ncbi:hypothetical protein AK812_SmicGene34691 [Symbiodinium microadriaticum]|uniref:Uncharacterized protein n=1 Tax=Symbiodinium microadriaticum TaxID=2951 RepID=A0A1Q9CNE3_SYMMI|nr:hypothetical protein AK812_SmicGene34691 [Symbiodinium microadriaticum]
MVAPPGDSWPEAQQADLPAASASSSSSGYAAAAAPRTSFSGAAASGASSSSAAPPKEDPADERQLPAGGLRRFIADLSMQLAEEVKRRQVEEAELERRAAEKRRLLEELEDVRKRRERLLIEQRSHEEAAADIERQHSELAEEWQLKLLICDLIFPVPVRFSVPEESELEKLREEAKARTGHGRDWARDGPEKDALVETKLQIAEAHEELAQLRQQLWLNREGLKRQLAELQAENMRLRTGRSVT